MFQRSRNFVGKIKCVMCGLISNYTHFTTVLEKRIREQNDSTKRMIKAQAYFQL